MVKRGLIISLVLLLLINSIFVIGTDGDDDITEEGGARTPQTDELTDVLTSSQGGTVTTTEPVTASGGEFSTITVPGGSTVSSDGKTQQASYASSATLKDSHAKIEGATDLTVESDGDYRIGRVNSLDQGPIILTDAYNVRWENGVMTAGRAASMDYKGSTSNDIIMLVADNKKFSVGKASAVQAGCFLVEDVENAEFNVGKIMTMTTSGTGKVVYDQGQKVEYAAKELNSSITGSITACRRPTYQVKAMELNTKTGNITEIVNGSGEIQLDGRYGVVCINLTPVSTYDIDTGRYEDSFGFVIRDYAYKLCIQKAVTQQLVADCPLCGLVDLANNKLLLNGVIEYVRYLYDAALIDANKRAAFRTTGFGKTVIDLQKGEVLIQQDEPEFQTFASDYLELREMKASEATHRFLGINEKLDRVSASWVNKYAAVYSGSKTTIVDNMLDYQKGACHVVVLPPQSSQISSIISSLNKQQVRYP
ncbi:MAG: hypothetical protein QXF14_03795 [Candidatus Woesearchaeota archaeon]